MDCLNSTPFDREGIIRISHFLGKPNDSTRQIPRSRALFGTVDKRGFSEDRVNILNGFMWAFGHFKRTLQRDSEVPNSFQRDSRDVAREIGKKPLGGNYPPDEIVVRFRSYHHHQVLEGNTAGVFFSSSKILLLQLCSPHFRRPLRH